MHGNKAHGSTYNAAWIYVRHVSDETYRKVDCGLDLQLSEPHEFVDRECTGHAGPLSIGFGDDLYNTAHELTNIVYVYRSRN